MELQEDFTAVKNPWIYLVIHFNVCFLFLKKKVNRFISWPATTLGVQDSIVAPSLCQGEILSTKTISWIEIVQITRNVSQKLARSQKTELVHSETFPVLWILIKIFVSILVIGAVYMLNFIFLFLNVCFKATLPTLCHILIMVSNFESQGTTSSIKTEPL